jgi:hypothetical protein
VKRKRAKVKESNWPKLYMAAKRPWRSAILIAGERAGKDSPSGMKLVCWAQGRILHPLAKKTHLLSLPYIFRAAGSKKQGLDERTITGCRKQTPKDQSKYRYKLVLTHSSRISNDQIGKPFPNLVTSLKAHPRLAHVLTPGGHFKTYTHLLALPRG